MDEFSEYTPYELIQQEFPGIESEIVNTIIGKHFTADEFTRELKTIKDIKEKEQELCVHNLIYKGYHHTYSCWKCGIEYDCSSCGYRASRKPDYGTKLVEGVCGNCKRKIEYYACKECKNNSCYCNCEHGFCSC